MKLVGFLFPVDRKIGRGEYALRLVAYFVVAYAISRLLAVTLGAAGSAVQLVVGLALLIVYVLFLWSMVIARLRDVGLPTWLSVFLLVPVVDVVMLFGLVIPPSRSHTHAPASANE